MKIERVGDSMRELLEQNEVSKSLMKVSDYIIYGFTALLVLSAFVSLGGFVNALFTWLFVALFILAFAGKKYLGLIILFSGKAFFSLYGMIVALVPSTSYNVMGFNVSVGVGYLNWDYLFGVVVYGLLIWLSVVLYLKSRPAKAPMPSQYMPPMQQNGMPVPPQYPGAPAAPQAPVPPTAAMPQAPAGNPVQTMNGAPLVDGKCPNCGAPCRSDMAFCVNCGQHLQPPKQ